MRLTPVYFQKRFMLCVWWCSAWHYPLRLSLVKISLVGLPQSLGTQFKSGLYPSKRDSICLCTMSDVQEHCKSKDSQFRHMEPRRSMISTRRLITNFEMPQKLQTGKKSIPRTWHHFIFPNDHPNIIDKINSALKSAVPLRSTN